MIEKPKHYENTIEKQETIGSVLDNELPTAVIYNLLTALKYFDRMGKKQYDGLSEADSYAKDASKCADYLHRAVTGRFLNEKQVDE